MDEAGKCDRVALIQSGKILSIDTPEAIVSQFSNDLFAVKANKMLPLLNDLKNFDEVKDAYFFGAYHHVVMKQKNKEKDLKNYLSKYTDEEFEMHRAMPNIEDCFMNLMNK